MNWAEVSQRKKSWLTLLEQGYPDRTGKKTSEEQSLFLCLCIIDRESESNGASWTELGHTRRAKKYPHAIEGGVRGKRPYLALAGSTALWSSLHKIPAASWWCGEHSPPRRSKWHPAGRTGGSEDKDTQRRQWSEAHLNRYRSKNRYTVRKLESVHPYFQGEPSRAVISRICTPRGN